MNEEEIGWLDWQTRPSLDQIFKIIEDWKIVEDRIMYVGEKIGSDETYPTKIENLGPTIVLASVNRWGDSSDEIRFPIEFLNHNDEDLKAYVEDQKAIKAKAETEKEAKYKEFRLKKEKEEYEKLKAKFES